MLSDRGSFSCFFRHSKLPPLFYMKFWEMQIPNLLRKAGWGNYDRFRFRQKISDCELEWILLESIEYSA
jgi:hypothetical protein